MSIYDRDDPSLRRIDPVLLEPAPASAMNWIIGFVVVLALAFAAWLFYGRLSDRFGSPSFTSTITQPAPAPYPVTPTPPSPSATTLPREAPPTTP